MNKLTFKCQRSSKRSRRSELRVWLSLFMLLLLILSTASCNLVPLPDTSSLITAGPEETSETEESSSEPAGTTSESQSPSTSTETSQEETSNANPTSGLQTDHTTSGQLQTSEQTSRPAYTNPETKATTTRTAAPTKAPTPTNTPTPVPTQPPQEDNFPYKNYGTYFRDEYGSSNSQVIEAHSGAVKLDVGSSPNGVVLVRVSSSLMGDKECIVIISANGQSYQYTVPDRDRYSGIPLNMGNGQHTIQIIEAIPVARDGGGYELVGTVLMTHSFSVSLASSLKPFTASSVKNDFSTGSSFVQKANALCSGITSADGKVSAVYTWIVNNISYDAALANKVNDANLNNEYITHIANPAVTYSTRKGICDDYAALMSAMLRSQGIPTRIIYGHVTLGSENLYHAWNEVFFEGKGWVVVASFSWKEIDGSGWVRFDSTFAASGSSPESIRDRNPPRERIY